MSASSMPRAVLLRVLDGLLKVYSKCRIIGNSYMSIEGCRARTCSRNRSVRTFLFYRSLIECSLWHLASLEASAKLAAKIGHGGLGPSYR